MSDNIVDIINQLQEGNVLVDSLRAALQDEVDNPLSSLTEDEKTSLRRIHGLSWPSRDKAEYIPSTVTKEVVLDVLAGKDNKQAWEDVACRLLMSSDDLLRRAKSVTHSKDGLARVLREALDTDEGKHLLNTVIVSEAHILGDPKPWYMTHRLGQYVSLADRVDTLEESVTQLQDKVGKHDVEIAKLRIEMQSLRKIVGNDGDLSNKHKIQYCKNVLKLSQNETAEAVGVNRRTVQRNWN